MKKNKKKEERQRRKLLFEAHCGGVTDSIRLQFGQVAIARTFENNIDVSLLPDGRHKR